MTRWFYFIQKVLPSASSLDNPRWSREPPGTGTRRTGTLHLTDQTPWIDRSMERRGEIVGFLKRSPPILLYDLCFTSPISPIFSMC